jgi:predicted phosphodiesterase
MRVLAIGDPHEPFCLKKYLRFCKDIDRKESCNRVVFIGDMIDNHYSSYHETDPDGFSAGQELDRAIEGVQKWYKAFPEAYVCIGNHDRMAYRKAFSAGVSYRWLTKYNDLLGTPGWKWVESVDIDGVKYCHGDGKKALQRARADMQSVVQGHYHTESYVQWVVGSNFKVFGMQVGCGIDHKSYAMAYGKHGPKPAIGCGVIKGGKTATNHMMEL